MIVVSEPSFRKFTVVRTVPLVFFTSTLTRSQDDTSPEYSQTSSQPACATHVDDVPTLKMFKKHPVGSAVGLGVGFGVGRGDGFGVGRRDGRADGSGEGERVGS